MNISCTRRGPVVTRRKLITAASAGVGSVVLGGVGFSAAPNLAQDIQLGGDPDATPAPPPVPTVAPPAGETVDDVAARLGFERDAIVAFVRDEIRYEAYPGILRGANGTLWARAGNSADQAALLSALLDAAQISHRFATGTLDAAGDMALTDMLSRTSRDVLAAWDAADTAALLYHLGVDELPATPPTLDPAIEARLGEFQASAQQAIDLALSSAGVSMAAIGDTLAGGGIRLPPLAAALAEGERQRHVWVQIADGPDWIDADPSLPEGTAIAAVAETFETMPDDWRHWLRFVIAADEWRAGSVRQREVVSLRAASTRLVGVPVALSMASAGELNEAGLTINQGLTGQKMVYPSIYADGVTVNAPAPLMFMTDAASGNPFGGASSVTLGEGETLAVWLRVEIASPDTEMIVIERPLLDRVPPEDRAAGSIAPERIQPLQIVPTDIGDDTLEQFNVVTIIHTDVARIPATDAFVRSNQDEVFGALGILGPVLAGFRDMLGATVETEAGCWSYPSGPNLTVFHASAANENGQATLMADLLYRQRTSLLLTDAVPATDAHPLVISGVLDAVAEQLLLAPETRGETGDGSTLAASPSAAAIFAEAVATGQAIRLVASAADLDAIALDPLSRVSMETSLEAGKIIVVPETPVDIGGMPVLGWWIIDPATGHTRDRLSNGMAGAASNVRIRTSVLFGNSPGYTFLLRAVMWVATRARALACMGLVIGAIYVFVKAMIGLADTAAAGGSFAKMALAGALAGGGIAGATIGCIA